MFERLYETQNNTLYDSREDDTDSILDSFFEDEEKDDCCKDPAECEHPLDETLLINKQGNIVDCDMLELTKNFKEDIDFEAFSSGSPESQLKIPGVNGFTEKAIKDKSLQEFLDESYILSEKAEWKYDKTLAQTNVKKLLEKKNPSMKKKGFLPLTSVNGDLKKTLSSLKSKGGMTAVKATKISGVVCIQYNFDSKSVGYVGVCYYNKETHKVRVFDVRCSVKLNEDIDILNETTLESSIITKASDVDLQSSKTAIDNARIKVKNFLDTGVYRQFKNSDLSLVKTALKNKYGRTVLAGSLLVGLVAGLSNGAFMGEWNDFNKEFNDTSLKIKATRDEMERSSKALTKADDAVKQAVSNAERMRQQSQRDNQMHQNIQDLMSQHQNMMNQMMNFNASYEDENMNDGSVLIESRPVFPVSEASSVTRSAIGGGILGTLLGGGIGKKLSEYIMNNLNYTVFKIKDLTILSVFVNRIWYFNTCFALLTKNDGSELKLIKLNLVGKEK